MEWKGRKVRSRRKQTREKFLLPIAILMAGLCVFASPALADKNRKNETAPAGMDESANQGLTVSSETAPDPRFQAPEKTVDLLAAKANNWREPSQRSEEIYVQAIRDWLDSLPPRERDLTRRILREVHPAMSSLREAIRDKKAELASLSFSSDTRPETLPRLGQELQSLRRSLRDELEKLGERLRIEAGVKMGPLGGDGFWLAPPPAKKS